MDVCVCVSERERERERERDSRSRRQSKEEEGLGKAKGWLACHARESPTASRHSRLANQPFNSKVNSKRGELGSVQQE